MQQKMSKIICPICKTEMKLTRENKYATPNGEYTQRWYGCVKCGGLFGIKEDNDLLRRLIQKRVKEANGRI